jgi:hypothetical protein
METLLINEQFVSQFRYWREGQLRTGMRFRCNLFEYVTKFSSRQRAQVFDFVERLSGTGKEVVVTASPSHYTIWVNLRTTPSSFGHLNPAVSAAFSSASQELVLLEACLSA